MSKPLISVCIVGYNQSLLFSRALHWLAKQDMPKEDWELIVVDDCGSEDWEALLEPYREVINIRYFRLEHDMGWRGCTASYNFAFEQARGEILMESNPHLLLPKNAVRTLYIAHKTELAQSHNGRMWVSLRGYCIPREDMPHFDTVDWREDLENLKKLPHFMNPWTLLWEDESKFYGSHLCCSVPRWLWFDEIAVTEHRGIVNERPGFPEVHCYGACDCWYAGRRQELGILSVNVHQPMFYHQDHWTHLELAKRFNVKSLLSEDGFSEIVAGWWGKPWKPVNPDGLWPAPPVPWESYIPGSGELPKLRPEFEFYYEQAEELCPWLAEELGRS